MSHMPDLNMTMRNTTKPSHTPTRSHAAPTRLMLRLGLALGLATLVAGCESLDMDNLNPFLEKEKKLTGQRQPVFPEGVPGVDYTAQRNQPAGTTNAIESLGTTPGGGTSGR